MIKTDKTTLRSTAIGVFLLLSIAQNSHAAVWGTWDYGAMTCSGRPEGPCDQGMSAGLHGSETVSLCSNHAAAPTSLDRLNFAVQQAHQEFNRTIQNSTFRRVALREPPAWSNSAAWSPDGASLIIADTKRRVLMQFSLDGHLQQTITALGSDLSLIQGTAGGYLVEARDGGFVWLDGRFSTQRTLDVKAETSDKPTKITSVFGWTSNGDNLLTVSDFEQGGTAKSSLLKISYHSPLVAEPIEAVGSKARRFFLLGYPLLANADNKGYMLMLEDTAKILEVGLGVRELHSFPSEYRTVPDLPTPKNAAEAFAPIERATMAISLIGWRDMLYLITRKPLGEGRTQWTMWPIQPREDRMLAGKVLPTQAAHILVVPGPKKWAILEKGPVLANGTQDISSVLLIEPRALEAASVVQDVPMTVVAP
jgi:hypothetical protein